MEIATIGRVLTEAVIENLGDLWNATHGTLSPEQVRRVVVTDAIVDAGATSLALPSRLIRQLGLEMRYEKRARFGAGNDTISVYDAVRVTIQGRDATVDVIEVPDDVPVIGSIPLLMMDLVVNLREQRLTGNPAHGGEQVLELY